MGILRVFKMLMSMTKLLDGYGTGCFPNLLNNSFLGRKRFSLFFFNVNVIYWCKRKYHVMTPDRKEFFTEVVLKNGRSTMNPKYPAP